MHAQSHGRRAAPRRGFTLVELAVVILVVMILLGLTIVVVGDTINGDRVRGAASTVQNYLAGARDRAIYAASRQESDSDIPPAVGVRFLPDPELLIPDDTSTPAVNERRDRAFGSMVFVQEVKPLATRLRVWQPSFGTPWKVSQVIDRDGQGPKQPEPVESGQMKQVRSVGSLIARNLIPKRNGFFELPVYFDVDASQEPHIVRFTPANVMPQNLGGWLIEGTLSKSFSNPALNGSELLCKFRLLPSPMPSEEPRLLPRGTVIDVESCRAGGNPIAGRLREDGSFDIMFNSKGVIEGPLAATGVVNLVMADAEDVERGFRIGSPFVDADGDSVADDSDGNGPDERQGDELIVSVRTQTGSIYVSDVNPVQSSSAPSLRSDPFLYAEAGGEAR